MTNRDRGSVVQEWLSENCSWKQQTVVLVALRGCDGLVKENPTKRFSRAMRGVVLKNADSDTGFIKEGYPKDEEMDALVDCIDALPIHYIMHFAHASAIIGYHHPDEKTSEFWKRVYYLICSTIHLKPESREEIDRRLRDAKEKVLSPSS